jgi:CCR4-NOT transcription complex subunit 1
MKLTSTIKRTCSKRYKLILFYLNYFLIKLIILNKSIQLIPPQLLILQDELISSVKSPNFVGLVCKAFEGGSRHKMVQQGLKIPEDYVSNILRSIKCTPVYGCVLAYSLTQSNIRSFVQDAVNFLKMRLNDIDSVSDVPDDALGSLFGFLTSTSDLASPEISGRFIEVYRSRWGQSSGALTAYSSTSVAARPSKVSVTAVLLDFGPACSASVEMFEKALHDTGRALDESQLGELLVSVLPGSRPLPGGSAGDMVFPTLQGVDEESGKSEQRWNLDVISDVLARECRGYNWVNVVRHFDQQTVTIKSEGAFQCLVKLVYKISGQPLKAEGLLGNWGNKTEQFHILAYASNAPRTSVDFSGIFTPENRLDGNVAMPENLSWVCSPLYSTLISLANRGLAPDVRELLISATRSFPEYVLLGMAQVNDNTSDVRKELLRGLLPLFTGGQGSRPTSMSVMKRLCEVNPELLVYLFRIGLKRASTVQEVIELDSRRKSFGVVGRRVEEEGSPDELLPYWCVLADRTDYQLEAKLVSVLERKIEFARYLVTFSKSYLEGLRPKANDGGILSIENFKVILRVIRGAPSVVSPEEINSLMAQAQQVLQQREAHAHAGISQGTLPAQPSHPSSQQQREDQMSRPSGADSKEIEELANAYFQKIYTSDITIPEVIQLLHKFKTSPLEREKEIFKCMIHNLFDEYRFFHKYPEKELQVTGRLFGNLIQHQLVSSITMGIALRYVLEALRKDPEVGGGSNEKMFRFGKISLEQFRPRLGEWPQYCSHLVQIPHLLRHCPDLFVEAQRFVNASTPPGVTVDQTGGDQTPVHQMANMSLVSPTLRASEVASELKVDVHATLSAVTESTLMTAVVESNVGASLRLAEIDRMALVNQETIITVVPPESVRDQIQFIINNVSKSNVDAKSRELKALLNNDHFVWFAHYLVVKRLSTQLNLHGMYIIVLDIIDSDELGKVILNCVYHNVTKLLQSPKITTSSAERSILRNLGTWLGQVTLSRNRPLLQRRIDLKELLFWGYETGRLIAVCSFVAKILEGAKDSKVFRIHNPWLMSILGVMRELYDLEDLKMNIKFEVQVLCNNINMKIEDIPRGTTLESRQAPNKIGSTDFNAKPGTAAGSTSPQPPTPSVVSPPPPVSLSTAQPLAPPVQPIALSALEAEGDRSQTPSTLDLLSEQTVIPNLASHVVINASLPFFQKSANSKKIVSLAIDRAIREMIQPVVERCSSIAGVSTKQLILKDFALESDDVKLRSSAHQMITNLAGSLALVTCKEPLRLSIGNHLRSLLAQAGLPADELERIIQTCSSDNIDLGCKLIEKVTMERAIKGTNYFKGLSYAHIFLRFILSSFSEADEFLNGAIQARRKQREAGQPFVDSNIRPGIRFPRDLPDLLKAKAGGLLPAQLAVYEGFKRLRGVPVSASPAVASEQGAVHGSSMVSVLQQQSAPGVQASAYRLDQVLEIFQKCLVRIDSSLAMAFQQSQGREITLQMLGNDHEIIHLVKEIVTVAKMAQPVVRAEAALAFAERLFGRLIDTMTPTDTLRLDVYVGILEALRDLADGSRKFSPEIYMAWLNNHVSQRVNLNDESGKKVHRSILLALLRYKLVGSQNIDKYFAVYMDGGRSILWVELALAFVRQCLADGVAATYEFTETFDTVSKMKPQDPNVRKKLQKLLTDLRTLAARKEAQKEEQRAAAPSTAAPVAMNPRDRELRDQVAALLEKWIRVWQTANEQVFADYLQLMHRFQVLKTEEAADRFFKVATELCVEACLNSGGLTENASVALNISFVVIDALSKLFLLLVKVADKESGDSEVRVRMLTRILGAVYRVLNEDHEQKKSVGALFDQRPYFRIFYNFSNDLGVPDMKKEPNPAIFPLLHAYGQTYNNLLPSTHPGFAFSWLQLISHKSFMPHLLLSRQRGWPLFHRLMVQLLLFLQPFLKTNQLHEPIKKLFKGTFRVLLVILHDFPEFLSEYHLSYCELIPINCVQMRNLILSAFPRTMRLPDPLTQQTLKMNLLPDISQPPRNSTDYVTLLNERGLKPRIDSYLVTKQPPDIVAQISQYLINPQTGVYNHPLITLVVVYIGSQASTTFLQSSPSGVLTANPATDIFKQLFAVHDAEGRYLILNAIANQLRYPNSHTYYFMNLLLFFFAETEDEFLQEQITRVLLERLIVQRPHPVS